MFTYYIPKKEVDDKVLSIKDIKDAIVSGCIFDFTDGSFLRLLLVCSGVTFDTTFYDEKVYVSKTDSGFRDLVQHGGLRETGNGSNKKYIHARANIFKRELKNAHNAYPDGIYYQLI